MTGTRLTGLEGTNPLGFFAALGIQVAFQETGNVPRLWWSDDVVPCAVVDDSYSVESIATRAVEVFAAWLENPAISHSLEPVGDVKFEPANISTYLRTARHGGPGSELAACLVAEGSLANRGVAKPTDFYFTSGNQKFLNTVREILMGVQEHDLYTGLAGPWSYESKIKSLMWDVADDRQYALSAKNPADQNNNPKLTNPGPEALAILGLSRFPVFGSPNRTITLGTSGSWEVGAFTWPIWAKPATFRSVSSLLFHASGSSSQLDKRSNSYASWGITRVMQSVIRRSSQGGYGTFGPPEVIWSRE